MTEQTDMSRGVHEGGTPSLAGPADVNVSEQPKRRCTAQTKAGKPCKSTSVGPDGLCGYHSGRAGLGSTENARKAARASVVARQEKAAQRRMTAKDHLAAALEQHAE